MKYAVASVLLLAALAVGQSWVVERLDSTAASRSPVELVKASDGRLWAGYQASSGAARVACLTDSGWNTMDVRSANVPGNNLRPFLAAGPHGELCLSCYSPSRDSGWLCRRVGDTWQSEPYPFMSQSVLGAVAYDTVGRLHTAFVDGGRRDFWEGHETDTGWTTGLVVTLPYTEYEVTNAACFTVAEDCSPWCHTMIRWEYTSHVWGEQSALMHFGGDTWETISSQGGLGTQVPSVSALVPHGGGVGRVSFYGIVLLCDSEIVDTVRYFVTAGLAYTTEDIPLVAWVPTATTAMPVFAFKTDRWRTGTIPGPAGRSGIDIETDTTGQVFIVYSTQDSGLWCARGTDVVGAKEAPGAAVRMASSGPTILSGAAGARRLASCVVFDAMGRRVLNPRSGIFFVREPSAVGGKPSAVTKVVVQH
jgi:hypothetical protein